MLVEKPSEKKTYTKNDGTEMLSKNISTKTVVQNVRIKMLAEKPFNKTTIKNDRTEIDAQKGIRKNGWSKYSHRKASWKRVRENYHWNDRTGVLPKYVSTETVVQNIRIKMVAEKPFEKTTNKKDGMKCWKNVSAKTVFKMHFSTVMLAEKVFFEQPTNKNLVQYFLDDCRPKLYGQKQSFKRSVLNC